MERAIKLNEIPFTALELNIVVSNCSGNLLLEYLKFQNWQCSIRLGNEEEI